MTSTKPHQPEHRYVAQIMGMPITLALRGRHTDDARANEMWTRVVESLHGVDEMFSTYKSSSTISRLNSGSLDIANCPPEVSEVLEIGRRAEKRCEGYFRLRLPDAEGTLRLDPSGLVKGWAVERAAALVADLESTSFCLSAGGDMVCHTADPAAEPWHIGIEDPHDPTRAVAIVPVLTAGVATSGTVHRGEHIVDPHTGLAPVGVSSVTVIGPSLMWADVYATAAYARGTDAASWLGSRRGYMGLVVNPDGSTVTVPGLASFA